MTTSSVQRCKTPTHAAASCNHGTAIKSRRSASGLKNFETYQILVQSIMSLNTAGKPTIAVVGAGPGIGEAVARRFATEGFVVALLARTKETLKAMAHEINNDMGKRTAHYYITDVPSEIRFSSILGRSVQNSDPYMRLPTTPALDESKAALFSTLRLRSLRTS